MCSIIGLIDFKKKYKNKKEIIFNLNKILKHRGPDDEGYYNNDYVSLGFNRLSIIDLQSGNQPIINNHVVSIFNGEIFNFKTLKEELKEKGFKFTTKSDSEVLNLAYQAWGPNFISKCEGMFAIAIYDLKTNKIYLYRDRVGIKPLYFHFNSDLMIFSSEMKGIINFPDFKKEINYSAIYSYLNFRFPINNSLNFFKGIFRVKPGFFYEIDIQNSTFKENEYWKIPDILYGKVQSENYYLEKLDYLLNKYIKSQMISDVPIGVFLSGGLDSSLISSVANKYSQETLNTFSVRFDEQAYDESSKTKLMQSHINSNHHNITIKKKDFFNNFEKIIKIKDAPISIPHEYPLYELSKYMNGKVKVVLSGEGADEFFGGYSRVQKSPFDFIKAKAFGKLSASRVVKSIFSLDKNFDFCNQNFKDFFFNRYKWFSLNESKNILNEDVFDKINLKDVLDPWEFSDDSSSDKDYLYNSILINFQKNHLQCLLDRLDIMTMSNSIEARVPFLEHKLIEFINSVPFQYKIKWKSQFSKFKSFFSNSENYTEKNDTNKYLLRKCSQKYLPEKISKEKKLGFPLPMNEWMRDEKIKEILFDNKTFQRGIFKKDEIEKLFLQKNKNDPFDFNGKKIWMILNIEFWLRNYF